MFKELENASLKQEHIENVQLLHKILSSNEKCELPLMVFLVLSCYHADSSQLSV